MKKLKFDKYKIAVLIILIIGFAVRLINLGKIPDGVNVDEASSGYEAYAIGNYGVDRNGKSMPVFLISWGSGQNALYSYMLIPFVKLFGLNVVTTRLPMAILGCISLIVMYKLLMLFKNKKLAIIGFAFFAICPWHIMKSRWGLESNIFPDLVLIGTYFIMLSIEKKKKWLNYLGFAILGISSYAYSTSYFFLPFFVIPLLIYLVVKKELKWWEALISICITGIIALPIMLYVLINTFNLPEIKLGVFTIPRLTTNRMKQLSSVFSGNPIIGSMLNFASSLAMLVKQNDGLIWSALDGYGTIYIFSIFFTILGIIQNFKRSNKHIRKNDLKNKKITSEENASDKTEKKIKLDDTDIYKNENDIIIKNIMNIWLIAAVLLMFVCEPNINRINIIMIPIIYYTIIGLYEIVNVSRTIMIVITILYVISFGLFVNKYWNTKFSNYLVFENGLEEVYNYLGSENKEEGTIAKRINENDNIKDIYIEYFYKEPYIYTLFYTQENPKFFNEQVELKSKDGYFDNVKSYGKYKYYLPEEVKPENGTIYVLENRNQKKQYEEQGFKVTEFNNFLVLESIE